MRARAWGWVERVRSAWTVDLSDRVRLAAVRSQILVAGSLLALASTLGVWFSDPAAYTRMSTPETVGTIVGLVAIGAFAAGAGRRMPDGAFLVLIIFDLCFAGITTWFATPYPAGVGAKIALGMVPTLIVGAMFSGRRWHVAVQVAAALALLVRFSSLSPTPGGPGVEVGAAMVALPMAAFVVRLLRDQSARTLVAARRGEVTDPLTGLSNRRGLERAGEPQWREHARGGQPLAVLAIDVDHFKKINDSAGHAAGDEVLRRLAEVVSANLRAGDVAVRMGGEEFLVLCEAVPEHAAVVAERLRRTIEHDLAPVTVSIGVHVAHPSEHEDPLAALWSAVDVADQALYSAKSGGRNQVVTIDV